MKKCPYYKIKIKIRLQYFFTKKESASVKNILKEVKIVTLLGKLFHCFIALTIKH